MATDNSSSQNTLTYKVYRSNSNNISTVSLATTNGTLVGSETANISTMNVTGLTASTTYYFNVIVKDQAGNQAIYNTLTQATSAAPDTTPPTPGNGGTITTSSVTSTSLNLNWTMATDAVTPQSGLTYRVFRSSTNNISTVALAIANGTEIGTEITNISGKSVTGLTVSTTYYFNVVVKDGAGNQAVYTTVSQTTTASPDTTPPTPGNSGILTVSNVGTNSLNINWTMGSDNVSAQSALTYRVFRSLSNNMTTVANTLANGTEIGSETANISSKSVSGLSANTTYYFNVVIKDVAGNQVIYTTVSQVTNGTVNIPSFSILSGGYDVEQNVTITVSSPASSTVIYTTDGTTPTANSSCTATNGTAISSGSSVTVSRSLTLQAIGCKSGWNNSSVKSATYTIHQIYFGTSSGVRRVPIGGGPSYSLVSSGAVSDVEYGYGIVYFTDYTNGIIYSYPASGGSLTTLVSGLTEPRGLILDTAASKIYFCEANGIGSIPIGGGSVTPILPSTAGITGVAYYNHLPADGGPTIYFTQYNSIKKISTSGGTVTTLITNLSISPSGLTISIGGDTIYFTDFNGIIGSVSSGSVDVSSYTTIASGLSGPYGLDLQGGTLMLYVATDSGVYKVGLGGTSTLLSSNSGSTGISLDY